MLTADGQCDTAIPLPGTIHELFENATEAFGDFDFLGKKGTRLVVSFPAARAANAGDLTPAQPRRTTNTDSSPTARRARRCTASAPACSRSSAGSTS